MNIYAAKTIFLEAASSITRQRENEGNKKRTLNELEQELSVAEKLLDNLAKNRNTNMQSLLKLNKKIEELKKYVVMLRQAS